MPDAKNSKLRTLWREKTGSRLQGWLSWMADLAPVSGRGGTHPSSQPHSLGVSNAARAASEGRDLVEKRGIY